MKDLTIIIVNYNGQFWLKQTLSSLKEFYLDKTTLNVEVVVVDNASSDDSVSMLKKNFKWASLIELEENVGFAAGNNVALKKVRSKYVMLLNSDMELTLDSNLDYLIQALEDRPKVGIVTPKLVLPSGEIDPACHRGEPTLWNSFTYFSKLAQLFPKQALFAGYHQTHKQLDTIHEIDACSGAAMVLRTKDIKRIGYLDEQFFMYAEDLDWCKRFRKAGFQILYYPIVEIIHHKNKSGIASEAKKIARRTSAYFYDTMLQYYDKHYHERYPKWIRSLIKTVVTLKKGVQ